MNVHKMLGDGFQEIGTCRVDFFVENLIMVELKALTAIEKIHLTQAKNYSEAYKMPIELLINFGSESLEFKRIFNNANVNN
jgi:GxxExxY protein